MRICAERKVFPASMDLIRLECSSVDGITNFVSRMEALLVDYEENVRKCEILTQLASYCLVMLSDLKRACYYVDEIMPLKTKYENFLMVSNQK